MAHDFKPGDVIWVDDLDDPWGPTGRYGNVFVKIDMDADNTEGEKPMAKIDWKKPLRALSMHGAPEPEKKVYTFKSGKQRVVWIDDHVYPVDDDGRAVAGVWYRDTPQVVPGEQIVENVPEEKFFVGLERQMDDTYVLYNDGVPDTREAVWEAACANWPLRSDWWLVDTRKSAEPPKVIEHDPKDWTVVRAVGNRTVSTDLLTGYHAQKMVADHGGVLVRVRETPAPADTARYVQLYRQKGSDGPWKINRISGRQEFTAAELDAGVFTERCNVKVRD